MKKIEMKTPLVEMDGDEMTRVLWSWIKEELIIPFVDLKTEHYDLGLPYRDETNDQVTTDAALAIKKYGVGVKCATITANSQRVEEYGLKKMWKSPNATIRGILDGTVLRTPILLESIPPSVRSWKLPITIARHAYGDIYSAVEHHTQKAGTAELVFTDEDGVVSRKTIAKLDGPGILQGMHNKEDSIRSFSHVCFQHALELGIDLWFSAKDTISKEYDQVFKNIFQEIFEKDYQTKFETAGIEYFYTLIDDAVARVVRSEGGFLWACKNYDGDVMSDMISNAFGSLAMMTSVLISPTGEFEYEAAHGTVTRHFYRYQKGESTSTNPIATIFAWSGALAKRGELDETPTLVHFAKMIEKASLDTLNMGIMTGDLARLTTQKNVTLVDSLGMIKAIRTTLTNLLG